jgi:hypothetical protein
MSTHRETFHGVAGRRYSLVELLSRWLWLVVALIHRFCEFLLVLLESALERHERQADGDYRVDPPVAPGMSSHLLLFYCCSNLMVSAFPILSIQSAK